MDSLFERVDWLYYLLVAAVALSPNRRFRFLGAAGLGLVLLAAASGRAAGPGGGTTFVTINEIMAALGVVVVVTAAIGAWRGRQGKNGEDRGRGPHELQSSPTFPAFPQPSPMLLTGLLLAAASPHLLLLELGLLLAVAAAFRQTLASRRFLWLVPLTAGAMLTGVGFYLILTILGPEGGSVAGIAEGPFSPAAERLIVTLLGAGMLLLSGLMPLHRAPWGLSLAPLAAILLVRILVPGVPGGLADWESLAILLFAAAAAASFFTGRWAAAAVAGGLVALWSGVPAGALAGQALVLWGWLSGTVARRHRGTEGLRHRASEPLSHRATAIVPGVAALHALQAGLGAEVVLSVSIVAAGIAACMVAFVRRSGPSPSPLY